MIALKVKSKDPEKTFEIKEAFHNALVGSPAYVNSEIIISDPKEDEPKDCFWLLIGNNNEDDITTEIEISEKDIIRDK